jgi:hypothetical protein
MEKEWPVTLKVEIEPEGLKRVVEEGRLIEFVDAFSTLASEVNTSRLNLSMRWQERALVWQKQIKV